MLMGIISAFLYFCMILIGNFTVHAEQLNKNISEGFYTTNGHHIHPEVPRITAFDAKRLFDQGKLILADAGTSENYKDHHLMGAIHLPKAETRKMNFVPPQNVIIAFYCG